MSKFTRLLRADAKYIRVNTGIRKGWSIRDCIEMAADGLRQEADERRYDRDDQRRVDADLDFMAAA